MAQKECPVPMVRKIRRYCSDSCVFYGLYTNPKTGETFLSCSKLHARIYPSDDAGPVETNTAERRSDLK